MTIAFSTLAVVSAIVFRRGVMEDQARVNRTWLLDLLDEAFDRKSWHGANLRGSIRALTPAVAAWRPAEGRHNIWELVVHAAYWKYAVRRRLTGEKRGSFPLEGSNWWRRPQQCLAPELKRDVALLVEEHARLRAAVDRLPAATLGKPVAGNGLTHIALIRGIAAHDLYHAGQIQLIKRLALQNATPSL
ncbi:MAG: DinB family protein [Vicinamibacterales bacterium]